MKAAFKIVFILSFLLVIAGLIVIVGAFAAADWDINNLSTEKFTTNEYAVTDDFDKISVNVKTADVAFLPSESGETKVVCLEKAKMTHTVSVESGTLNIKLFDERKWYDHISLFSFKSPKITVYLPKSEYNSLILKGDTGDVSLSESFSFDSLYIEVDTGDVNTSASVGSSLKIETDTGDVKLFGTHKGNVEISTDTGDIKVKASCEGANLDVKVGTGDVELEDVLCANLSIETDTGDVELSSVIASGTLTIETDTGDVELSGCDAKDIFIETDTGDVEGTLLSEKHFIVKSQTGRTNYPEEMIAEGKCKITTDTGDVNISVK